MIKTSSGVFCYTQDMYKKVLAAFIVIFGLGLTMYGIVNAPVSNEIEIRSIYSCDRLTNEALSTDEYCTDPSSAPEASKQLMNPYVYSGIALIVIGSTYFVVNRKQQDR
jgi:hypothetical protein